MWCWNRPTGQPTLGAIDGIIKLGSDLHDNLAAADQAEAEFVILTELDVDAAGITNVIWATGYSFDFSMIKLSVTDSDGFPIQTRGVTAFPGLFFVGLPWLHTAKSGLIFGLSEDARYVADRIADRRNAAEHEHVSVVPLRISSPMVQQWSST
jgi:putative flavoprotein involved in K+ transport